MSLENLLLGGQTFFCTLDSCWMYRTARHPIRSSDLGFPESAKVQPVTAGVVQNAANLQSELSIYF